jgi:uncharacterized membrane protein YgaE (UPF0421/DUF939 family)
MLARFTLDRLYRSAKVGIAGVVALAVAHWFRLPQAYWAAISAFVVMAGDVAATVRASRNRLFGTAIGAVTGAVFSYFCGGSWWSFGLAATATVLLCSLLNLEQSYRLACVTVAIVMLIQGVGSPWLIALHRFLEVALGIVVALGISALPPRESGSKAQVAPSSHG